MNNFCAVDIFVNRTDFASGNVMTQSTCTMHKIHEKQIVYEVKRKILKNNYHLRIAHLFCSTAFKKCVPCTGPNSISPQTDVTAIEYPIKSGKVVIIMKSSTVITTVNCFYTFSLVGCLCHPE